MLTPPHRPRRAASALVVAFVLILLGVQSASARPSAPVDDAESPTAQLNGVAFAQVVVGRTVYVGGRFTTARPAGSAPGARTVRRSNLLAYDLDTGRLKSWAPTTNGVVRALAATPDGTVYAAGSFTRAGGAPRDRIAAFDASSGRLRPAFRPRPNGTVSALAVHGSTVYLGGTFTAVGSTRRTRAAAVQRVTGALRPWRPVLDDAVLAITVSPAGGSAVLGGRFAHVNGRSAPGSQRVGTRIGTRNLTWKVNRVVRNRGGAAAVYSLSSSGGYVYGTGYSYGSTVRGRLEGAFVASWRDGAIHWIEDCHGDSYAAARSGSVVYVVGHAHDCANVGGFGSTTPTTYHRALAFTQGRTGRLARNRVRPYSDFGGQPSPTLLPWMPEFDTGSATGQEQGPWSVTTARGWVLVAGEFRHVNGRPQQGLVRFRG